MDWTQTITIVASILAASGLVVTVVLSMGKRIDDMGKRIDDVMLQLSELRQAILNLLPPYPSGADDDDDDE